MIKPKNRFHGKSLYTLFLLLWQICFSLHVMGQSIILKGLESDTNGQLGISFLRYKSDSIVWLGKNQSNQSSYPAGFDIYVSDTSFNFNPVSRCLTYQISASGMAETGDQQFIVYGARYDTIITPTSFYYQAGFSIVKMNYEGDTIWTSSYISTDTIEGVEFSYTGRLSDTLIFHGWISPDVIAYDECGLLLFVSNTNGAILGVKSYCDSIYACNFYHSLVDTVEHEIHITGDKIAKNGSTFFQFFYLKLDSQGNVLNGIEISDLSSSKSKGFLLQSKMGKNILMGYQTGKHSNSQLNFDFEITIINNSGQLLKSKYIPNLMLASLPFFTAEEIAPGNKYRIWGDKYFIDIDDSINYQSSNRLLYNMSYVYNTKWQTFNDMILGSASYYKNSISSNDVFTIKTGINGDNCFSTPLTLPINLTLSQILFKPFNPILNNYTTLISIPINIIQSTFINNDSLFCLTTNLNNIDEASGKLVLSPNPIQNEAMVSLLQSGNENYIQRLQVHDVNGKLLLSKENLNTTNDLINASGLADGIYILTVTTNHQTETLKFVVNKGQ